MNNVITFVLLLLVVQTAFSFRPTMVRHKLSTSMSPISCPTLTPARTRNAELYMGGKQAKFGPFSPAVYVGKFVLGEQKFNKFRAKIISLHSQIITEFCIQYGAYNMRVRLIKKAKVNGDKLGFLS
jgi:hypothetical protein